MTAGELVPLPAHCVPFRRDCLRAVAAVSGCYALTTALGVVLYLGLAKDLRARMRQHLDNPEKVMPTPRGRAVQFHWIEATALEQVERGWLNAYGIIHGELPILNKVGSPISC